MKRPQVAKKVFQLDITFSGAFSVYLFFELCTCSVIAKQGFHLSRQNDLEDELLEKLKINLMEKNPPCLSLGQDNRHSSLNSTGMLHL